MNQWWKDAIIYQVYPRSFCDSNGDGLGDIPGIISKLDYLQRLGVDAIWLSPVFRSPQDDNGYDISDYQDIDPMFGTLSDMDELIAQARKRKIRIIMDLVLSHSSDEHPWFREAKKSRQNPWHDFYIWRDGQPDNPPNDLESAFGGSAWEWVPEVEQFYFHRFSKKQPDLNWENPQMRQGLYAMIRWWADRGIGGFRLDVVDLFGKIPDQKILENGPKLHEYIREMRREAFTAPDLVTVGEAWSATPAIARQYSAPDGSELSMVFQFEHLVLDQQPGGEKWNLAPLPLGQLKQVICRWQQELAGTGWNSLFLENHDLPRIVSRWGDDGKYREASAKMLASLLFGLQGTPYIYQGQELGMTNVRYPLEEYRDIETLGMYRKYKALGWPEEKILRSIHARSRDNARTPMQWSGAENAGFTTGTPWLKVNPNYKTINADNQLSDPDSVFSYYQRLIRLRKGHPVFREGAFRLVLADHEDIFAYTRTTATAQLLVVCNFRGADIEDPLAIGETPILCNYPDQPLLGRLRPYEARIYLKSQEENP